MERRGNQQAGPEHTTFFMLHAVNQAIQATPFQPATRVVPDQRAFIKVGGGAFAERSIAELYGAADAEFANASLECGALHAKKGGGAFGTGDAPFGLAQGAEDVLAVGFFEGGDRGD